MVGADGEKNKKRRVTVLDELEDAPEEGEEEEDNDDFVTISKREKWKGRYEEEDDKDNAYLLITPGAKRANAGRQRRGRAQRGRGGCAGEG